MNSENLITVEIAILVAEIEDRLMRIQKSQTDLGNFEGDDEKSYIEKLRINYEIPKNVYIFRDEQTNFPKNNLKILRPYIRAFVKGKLTERAMLDFLFYFEECYECDYGWILIERPMGFYSHETDVLQEIELIGTRSITKNKKLNLLNKMQNNTQIRPLDALVHSASFAEFPKISRLSRECLITEKIDGTNAQILITENGQMLTGSRTRWITPENDNFGFARWAMEHRDELLQLGPGRHFGEWWGQGIQRNYGMSERRWSLFNVGRWCPNGETPQKILTADPLIVKTQDMLPQCCHLVPVLRRCKFSSGIVESALHELRKRGSLAAPGYKFPEGVVIFHIAGNVGFKKTLEKDEVPKGVSLLNV